MKVILYESSSKGGCYEYAQYLHRAFIKEGFFSTLVLPSGSVLAHCPDDACVQKLLCNDRSVPSSRIKSKIVFLYRQIFNPLFFLVYLIRQPSSVVIWNDFEQLSAPFWSVLLNLFARKHFHVIVLHDPDRDNYPPSKKYAVFCMNRIMRQMNLAIYHSYLPDKPYYKNNNVIYRSAVHGIYDRSNEDKSMYQRIMEQKGSDTLLGIIGNIRDEKNYTLIIQALKELPQTKLLIAGAAANSAVHIDALLEVAEEAGVSARIIWEIRFLTEAELSSAIQVCDIILLYYKERFTSQSGILNTLAPYRKKYIYTESLSGLSLISKKYGIGVPCAPDSIKSLITVLKQMHTGATEQAENWDAYLNDTEWANIVRIIQQSYQTHFIE